MVCAFVSNRSIFFIDRSTGISGRDIYSVHKAVLETPKEQIFFSSSEIIFIFEDKIRLGLLHLSYMGLYSIRSTCGSNDRSKVASAIVGNYFFLLLGDKPLKSSVRKDPQEYQSGSIRAERVKPVLTSLGITANCELLQGLSSRLC